MADRGNAATNGFDRQHFLSNSEPVADALRDHLLDGLRELMDSFYRRAHEASIDNPAAQDGELRDALNQLRINQKSLSKHLLDAVARNFDPDAEQRAMQATINISFEDLSLQKPESLDESIAATNVGNRCELLYEHQLWEIRQRMEWWRDERYPRISDKSLGPYAICRAFFDAMRDSEIDKQLQLVLFSQFDRFVMRHLHETYEELIQIFDHHGFHPLRPQSQRTETASTPSQTAEDAGPVAMPTDAQGSADSATGAPAPANAAPGRMASASPIAPIDPQTWQMLQQLGQLAESDYGAQGAGGGAAPGAAGAGTGAGGGVAPGAGGPGAGGGAAPGAAGAGGGPATGAGGPGAGGGAAPGAAGAGPGAGGGVAPGAGGAGAGGGAAPGAGGPGAGGGAAPGAAGAGGGPATGAGAGPGAGSGAISGAGAAPAGGAQAGTAGDAPSGDGQMAETGNYGDAQLANDLSALFRGEPAQGWNPDRSRDINARVLTLGRAFNQLLADPNLTRSIKPQFDSLRFSLLKTALADARFFRDAKHPMRELLNELALLAMTSRLYMPDEVRHLSQMLLQLHQQYASSAQQVRDAQSHEEEISEKELERFLDELQKEQRKRREALIDKSRRVVSEELWLQLAHRRCSEQLRESLSNSWEPMMALRLLRHGVDSKAWNRGIRLLKQIVDLADPPTGLEIKEGQQDKVLQEFAGALREVGMMDERVNGLLRSLQSSLSEAAPRQRGQDHQAKVVDPDSLPDTSEELLQILLVPKSWFEVYDKQRDTIRWLQARGFEHDEAVFSEFRGQQELRLPGKDFISDLGKNLSAPINPTPRARAALHALTRSE